MVSKEVDDIAKGVTLALCKVLVVPTITGAVGAFLGSVIVAGVREATWAVPLGFVLGALGGLGILIANAHSPLTTPPNPNAEKPEEPKPPEPTMKRIAEKPAKAALPIWSRDLSAGESAAAIVGSVLLMLLLLYAIAA